MEQMREKEMRRMMEVELFQHRSRPAHPPRLVKGELGGRVRGREQCMYSGNWMKEKRKRCKRHIRHLYESCRCFYSQKQR